jgi:hypothetical protein
MDRTMIRFELVLICLCVVALGCNSDPRCRRETALLRAEILDIEDKYYLLKSERDAALAKLNIYQGGSETFVADNEIYGDPIYSSDGPFINDGQIIYESEYIAPSDSPKTIISSGSESRGSSSQNLESITPLEMSDPSSSDPNSPFNLDIQMDDASPMPKEIDPLNGSPSVLEDQQSNLMLNAPITNSNGSDISKVVINRSQTRGQDIDGVPGDEGLDLLIQPKTRNGQTLLRAGRLTVSVIDPSKPPSSQRIGLWKFLPSETELFFANEDAESRGILLHLPWDQATPQNGKLKVFVRYETPAGRKLETSSDIRIEPPRSSYANDDPLIAGWTQRDHRWSNSSESSEAMDAETGRGYSSINSPFEENFAGRKTYPAMPVGSGSSRITKPTWRPIR